jgi:glucokinase
MRLFVVVAGLPGSGKSTLARRIAAALALPLIDKDDILAGSGTPIDWLSMLSDRVVSVRCVCPVAVAAERFRKRRRHPGHLDDQRTPQELIDSIEAVAALRPLDIGHSIDVDTSGDVDADAVVAAIRRLIV